MPSFRIFALISVESWPSFLIFVLISAGSCARIGTAPRKETKIRKTARVFSIGVSSKFGESTDILLNEDYKTVTVAAASAGRNNDVCYLFVLRNLRHLRINLEVRSCTS